MLRSLSGSEHPPPELQYLMENKKMPGVRKHCESIIKSLCYLTNSKHRSHTCDEFVSNTSHAYVESYRTLINFNKSLVSYFFSQRIPHQMASSQVFVWAEASSYFWDFYSGPEGHKKIRCK